MSGLPPGYSLRAFRPDDGPALLRLHVDAIHTVPGAFYTAEQRQSWAHGKAESDYAAAERAGEALLVAVDPDDRPAGFCSVRDGAVVALYVAPERQRLGLGRALMAAAEARIRASGAGLIHVQGPLSARPFYQAMGYRVVEIADQVTRGGMRLPTVIMEKPARPASP